jgi:hypothetical protein
VGLASGLGHRRQYGMLVVAALTPPFLPFTIRVFYLPFILSLDCRFFFFFSPFCIHFLFVRYPVLLLFMTFCIPSHSLYIGSQLYNYYAFGLMIPELNPLYMPRFSLFLVMWSEALYNFSLIMTYLIHNYNLCRTSWQNLDREMDRGWIDISNTVYGTLPSHTPSSSREQYTPPSPSTASNPRALQFHRTRQTRDPKRRR